MWLTRSTHLIFAYLVDFVQFLPGTNLVYGACEDCLVSNKLYFAARPSIYSSSGLPELSSISYRQITITIICLWLIDDNSGSPDVWLKGQDFCDYLSSVTEKELIYTEIFLLRLFRSVSPSLTEDLFAHKDFKRALFSK